MTIYINPYQSIDLPSEIERTDKRALAFRELLCRDIDTSKYTNDEVWDALEKLLRLYVAKLIHEIEHPELPREYLTPDLLQTLSRGAQVDWKRKAKFEAFVADERAKRKLEVEQENPA